MFPIPFVPTFLNKKAGKIGKIHQKLNLFTTLHFTKHFFITTPSSWALTLIFLTIFVLIKKQKLKKNKKNVNMQVFLKIKELMREIQKIGVLSVFWENFIVCS